MRCRQRINFLVSLGLAAFGARAQSPAPVESGATIRTESRLVLVDAVVTDKKGAYVHDLTAKDFRVWEDNKEQTIKTFSSEAQPSSPSSGRPHYLVFFFDNSTMDLADQARARQAAAQFVEKQAGKDGFLKDRFMAVANFGGSLQIPQNFTNDAQRIQAALKVSKFSSVTSDAGNSSAPPGIAALEAGFGARNMIQSLKGLAKSLNSIPGRKILVLFTNGFPVSQDQMFDVTSAIDASNKANVAIYPIDVRGLVAPGAAELRIPQFPTAGLLASNGRYFLDSSALYQVKGTGGRPTGGGTSPVRGGGTSPVRGTTPTNTGSALPGSLASPNTRSIVPPIPPSAQVNQQLMYLLAEGTGGFVIANTNGLLDGLDRIGQEQNEYYILGYTPLVDEQHGCHSLRVKVNHSGASVRARTGYCNAKPLDALAGNTAEKSLEARAATSGEGSVRASMRIPYFYAASNVARVNVAMEIEHGAFKFQKQKGKFHGEINLLGLAYTADGTIAARFSDALKLDLDDQKQVDAVQEKVLHYENQFEIAPGRYTLKVAFTGDGETYGRLEMPLTVDPYKEGQFGVSDLALSRVVRDASQQAATADAALLEDRVPLIAHGLQMVPTGDARFLKTEPATVYFEVYEPLLANPDPQKPTLVGMQLKILNSQGQAARDSGGMRMDLSKATGSPVIPEALHLPIENLEPGSYRVELQLLDSAGRTAVRSTPIEVR